MPHLNQKGPARRQAGFIAQLLILLLLGVGLAVGFYLVQQKTNIFSRASVSKPISPETSFTLIGPNQCASGGVCAPVQFIGPPVGGEFGVNIYARSDIETANLFTAKMTFPKDLVEVKEIKTDGSFIKNWMENYFDNSKGTISLTGGVPAPGYQTRVGGESALMATIIFRAKSIGKGSVTFADSSVIYSNLNSINILTIKRPYDISVEVKPSPKPTCQPRPACLDSKPACKMPEPIGGWCPTACPTPPPCSGQIIFGDPSPSNPNQCPKYICQPTPSPTPKPTCTPRPACLDATPACKMPEPVGGWCFKNSGDVNGDGKINLVDMSRLLAQFNKSGQSTADMNGDGKINVVDILLLRDVLVKNGVLSPGTLKKACNSNADCQTNETCLTATGTVPVLPPNAAIPPVPKVCWPNNEPLPQ